jgi:hypothetical protein
VPNPYPGSVRFPLKTGNLTQLVPTIYPIPVWTAIESQYYDLYVLRALQQAKEHFLPGDVLSRDEAISFLSAAEVVTTTEQPLS